MESIRAPFLSLQVANSGFITGAVGFQAGDIYSFPDGPSGESPEQTDEDSFQENLFEKIAMEISCAEEQEKEIEKRQEEAVTQQEMNLTAPSLPLE